MASGLSRYRRYSSRRFRKMASGLFMRAVVEVTPRQSAQCLTGHQNNSVSKLQVHKPAVNPSTEPKRVPAIAADGKALGARKPGLHTHNIPTSASTHRTT